MASIGISAKVLPTNNPEYQFKSETQKISGSEGFVAAMPLILIFVLLLLTSKLVPAINGPLSAIKTSVPIYAGPGAKPYTFVWIATPGIMIFLSAFIGGAVQKAGFGEMLGVLGKTFNGLKFTYITIISVVVTAKIMTYSGMTANIADGLVAATGTLYPAFAPLIGALGSFLTGSGTNSNVLFGPLQTAAAQKLIPGDGELALWLTAASSAATGIGKMFSPQSIAIAIGAVAPALDEYVKENKIDAAKAKELHDSIEPSSIMRHIFKYFLLYVIVAGIICYLNIGQGII